MILYLVLNDSVDVASLRPFEHVRFHFRRNMFQEDNSKGLCLESLTTVFPKGLRVFQFPKPLASKDASERPQCGTNSKHTVSCKSQPRPVLGCKLAVTLCD